MSAVTEVLNTFYEPKNIVQKQPLFNNRSPYHL